ncbi:MAG: hypothetical protein J6X86_07345 [Bacteroidales bacterium]|nr:hypothetical protein [Bacteroidales bacterium]
MKNILTIICTALLLSAIVPSAYCQNNENNAETALDRYNRETQTYPYDLKRETEKKRHKATREGVKQLKEGNYKEAIEKFKKALEYDSNYTIALFNTSYAYNKIDSTDKALEFYNKVCDNASSTIEQRVKAHYNMGNIYLRKFLIERDSNRYDKEDLVAAIEQYKSALRLDSKNRNAKSNLTLAKKLLRPEPQQNQQGGQNKDQQDKQKQQDQQNQQNKDQQNKDQQNKDQKQNKDQQNKDQKQNKDQQNKDQQNKDKQDQKKKEQRQREAEQMLNAAKNNEQKTMREVRMKKSKDEGKGVPVRIEKDW